MNYFILLFLFLLTLSSNAQLNYVVNTQISKVEWEGRKITGEHQGTIQVQSGSLIIEDGIIQSGIIYIDMNSIVITDIESESSREKLMNVFKDDNFFNPKKYGKAILKITSSKTLENKRVEIKGILTIKDISKEISFTTTYLKEEEKLVFIGKLDIDRTDFNVQYGSGFFSSLGDNAIKDLFGISFKIAASQP